MKSVVYDVFIGESAKGNPCAVVELEDCSGTWPEDAELLRLTQELQQPVTSFVRLREGKFQIRWFAQQSEINLCGHGSLGAGAMMLDKYQLNEVIFRSPHGKVTISKIGDCYGITLPAWRGTGCAIPEAITGLAEHAIDVFATRDLVLVLPDEAAVKALKPDFEILLNITEYHALIATARSGASEYVLRYFAPGIGIDEDRATGSAQCSLAPYWFDKLGAQTLTARQLSSAGGYFKVEKQADDMISVHARVKARQI